MGAFSNYVDQILPNFDHLPTSWTSVDIWLPTTFVHLDKPHPHCVLKSQIEDHTANILIVNITIFYRVSFIIVIWS